MWIKRTIEAELLKAVKQRPSVLLTGSRQSGKTSILQKTFPNYGYISLDPPHVAEEAEESGGQFLQKHPAPLILDEVQYAPRLFRHLKSVIDDRRKESGLYLLTGSQKFSLMQGVTESLAGRISVFELHSLSLAELEHWSGKCAEGEQLLEWLLLGGYPELHERGLKPERYYSDYLVTYLERDVRQLIKVRDLRDFDRFMRLAAARTGQLLSITNFSSDLGLSPLTVKSWLSVLEASNIIYLLEPFYKNLGKRIVKTPKLYFLDTGLACYLSGIRTTMDLKGSGLIGALFETIVLGQMVRWHTNQGKQPALYFWRDHTGHEVDFVIPIGDKLKLIECKWSESSPDRVKGFEEIEKLQGGDRIISKSVITSLRSARKTKMNFFIDNAVELKMLSG